MAMTLSEKILARAAGRAEVSPGEIVEVPVDVAMIHEGTGPLALKSFRSLGLEKVWDPSKVVVILDHYAPSPSEAAAENQKMLRDFAKEQGIAAFYDIDQGICHQVLPEKGHALPGQILVGTDSHTCTAGALGVFATGIGSTEMAGVFATGRIWFKVPESLKLVYRGSIPPYITPMDIILATMKRLTSEGGNYKALEFAGPVVEAMTVGQRMTLCNMAIEMGGKVGMVAPDAVTLAYLRDRAKEPFQALAPDADATYEETIEFDISRLVPQVACPHSVDNVRDIGEVEGTTIHQAFLGTCTNGRLEDLRLGAAVVKGKKIPPSVRMIVIPASREVFLGALKEGLVQTFVEAGAIVANPNCGPCCGNHQGILAPGEVCLSTANRNFSGRMGRGAQLYLASPQVVAASAVAGRIVHPARLWQAG
ncbi:MAG: 3-isopropylmalate dehydratase large subunit [Chloroflexi bacterium]|nr:3-isopropylmalate dehydratase large subunit [Chloroflexota bacterium]